MSYTSLFGGFSFDRFGSDGPWVFFDDQANAFIFSPASHYMNAALSLGAHNEVTSRIAADAGQVSAGFVKTDVLVIEPGINRAFETWGRFLTDLAGKRRPPNGADVTLNYLGYWTDHGTQYYYNFEPELEYAGTLLKIRDEFRAKQIRLGYVQLDSWFYPKGHEGRWQSADGGTYLYEASRDLFPEGLAAFQRKLGMPLITHNRWIDEASPYRKAYAISGNVPIDRRLWDEWMRSLRASGVHMYEQDWLSGPAVPKRDLTSGDTFMDAMAGAAKRAGIVLQYSMPLPRHFLQGSRYSNLLTIRTSGDRFGKDHWEEFLFNGRLASALGEWPWSDAVRSTETSNLLLSVLSGSSAGVGDAIGSLDGENLRRAIRADGVIVKPDDAITPIDPAYLAAAHGRLSPLIAAAHTRHQGLVTTYLFACRRSGERTATVSPAALGYERPIFAFDYFGGQGVYLRSSQALTFPVPDDGAYWITVPVGASGVGFLGEDGKFVPNGKKRVAGLRDKGTLRARIVFAPGEKRLRFKGFALARPQLHARRGAVENVAYDLHSHLFHFDLAAKQGASVVTLWAAAKAEPRALPVLHRQKD